MAAHDWTTVSDGALLDAVISSTESPARNELRARLARYSTSRDTLVYLKAALEHKLATTRATRQADKGSTSWELDLLDTRLAVYEEILEGLRA